MTENEIKEELSRSYIKSVANFLGYKIEIPERDHGTDCRIVEVTPIHKGDKIKYRDSGRLIDIQLKATTEESVEFEGDFIKYDLEAKAYNDLIFRLKGVHYLVLIVFVLPKDKKDWVSCSDNELILRKNAYWFLPSDIDEETDNKSSIRIKIPLKNRFSFDSIQQLFELQY